MKFLSDEKCNGYFSFLAGVSWMLLTCWIGFFPARIDWSSEKVGPI
jgi:hypothetical protein